ncbi:MAG: Co2+/Mg2+ efflux protein ApaG [Bacteroidia bacterium]|jgi:ApaG protein|nr:Co2+/Mg2+ efflux protein ApaG [Bacteroidia bacterium]
MASNLASTVTEGIRVNVRTSYVRDESSPRHQYYVFAYEIEIINESLTAVQLISREWHIVNGVGEKRMVRGNGVVGHQPRIAPGESYRYVSGSHFQTPVGMMQGHYEMRRPDGEELVKVQIPAFTMIVPYLLN